MPFDILVEVLPSENRGSYLFLVEYFWTAGSIFVPLVAYLTIEKFGSWRIFVVICAIPCAISFIAGIVHVPESPRWLMTQERNEEALKILRNGAALNKKNPEHVFPQGCRIRNEQVDEAEVSIGELFKPRWRRIIILLSIAWFGQATCYYGTVMAITRIFDNEDEQEVDCNKSSFDYSAILISSLAEIVAVAGSKLLVDRIGRIPLAVGSYFFGSVSLFLLCSLHDQMQRQGLIFFSFLSRIFQMSGSCVIWVITSEVLSTEIRSTGHSALNAVGKVGGFVSPYVVSGQLSYPQLGVFMLMLNLLTAMCISRLPETKGVNLGHALPVDDATLDDDSEKSVEIIRTPDETEII